MKSNLTRTALCCLAFTTPGLADTFTLKDGTSLNAKIVSETTDAYVLEVQVTKGIKDGRTVAKADVIKVSREQPDFKAFQAIANLVPTPDLVTAEEGLARIAQLEKFLHDHGTSPSAKEVRGMLTTLQKESAAISAGGIKVSGKIVLPTEYESNAYEFDSQISEIKIRSFVNDGEFLRALRLFSSFDADYPTTLSYGAILSLIRQVTQNQLSEAKQSLATLPDRLKKRENGLLQMAAADRAATQAAIQEETAQLETRYKAEHMSKLKWVTTDPFHKASLQDTVRLGEAELVRLSVTKIVLGVDGGKCYREAYRAVHNGENNAMVTAALGRAKAAMVPARYLAPLENIAKGRK